MRRMGFTHHPGALPFVTVRDRKWANRLTVGELIEVHGEHGCDMPSIAARVVDVHSIADSTAGIYPPGTPLCAVSLEAAPPGWRKVGHPVHGDWIFEPKVLDAHEKSVP